MKIALIGNLAGVAYTWSKLLRRKGLAVDLYLTPWEWGPDWEDTEFRSESNRWIHFYDRPAPRLEYLPIFRHRVSNLHRKVTANLLLRELLGYDIVNSFTGSLFLSQDAIKAFGKERRKPYIACATGSDIREVAIQDGQAGKQMLQFFQQAARSLLLNLDMVEVRDELGLRNAEFFPYLIDFDKYCPDVVNKEYGSKNQTLFFMFSNLDWGVIDNAPRRSSTKGNDRFIRAFARYVKEHSDAYLMILDRGPDRELAKQLVSQLAISSFVSFLPEMRKDELVKHFRMSDVIADQFDVGALGVGALEAMACAKPVMIYLKSHCVAECYPEFPPILNARTEDEIYEQIKLASNRAHREEIARKARKWILKYHDWNIVADRLIRLYEEVSHDWKRP